MKTNRIRLAVIGDLHYKESNNDDLKIIFNELSRKSDIIALCGDLTDSGRIKQAEALSEDLKYIDIPIMAVLGNHDFENSKQEEIKNILNSNRVKVLDGDIYVFKQIGFTGVKGFMGGFDNHTLASWGESIIKQFVYEVVNESLKLENALSKLETKQKIVLMHYSPIHQTTIGEHPEIIPYCGSSKLVEPLDQFNISMAFHGHAHHGRPNGTTNRGIPVYNAAYPLLKKLYPKKPYVIIEI